MLSFKYFGIFILFNLRLIHSAPITCDIPQIAEKGQCVDIKNCTHIYTKLKTSIVLPDDFAFFRLRKEICSSHIDTVCCEISKIALATTEIQTTATTTESTTTSKSATTVTQDRIAAPNELNIDFKKHENFKLFNYKKCGNSDQNRIAFGEDAGLLVHPWAVRLGYLDTERKKAVYICEGSLISEYYVLTAAHCVKNLPSGKKFNHVILGDYDTSTELDCIDGTNCAEPTQKVELEEVVPHPNYIFRKNRPDLPKLISNDIALIRLKDPANLKQKNIATICLPFDKDANPAKTEYTVIGWGSTENASSSTILQKTTVPFVNLEECTDEYKKMNVEILDLNICAGNKGTSDACKGDSGGPLLEHGLVNGKLRKVQYGIVSFGVGRCGQQTLPGVYTDVSKYMYWILDNMH